MFSKINSDLATWMRSFFSRRLPCRSKIVDVHVAGPQDVDFDKVTDADFGPEAQIQTNNNDDPVWLSDGSSTSSAALT